MVGGTGNRNSASLDAGTAGNAASGSSSALPNAHHSGGSTSTPGRSVAAATPQAYSAVQSPGLPGSAAANSSLARSLRTDRWEGRSYRFAPPVAQGSSSHSYSQQPQTAHYSDFHLPSNAVLPSAGTTGSPMGRRASKARRASSGARSAGAGEQERFSAQYGGAGERGHLSDISTRSFDDVEGAQQQQQQQHAQQARQSGSGGWRSKARSITGRNFSASFAPATSSPKAHTLGQHQYQQHGGSAAVAASQPANAVGGAAFSPSSYTADEDLIRDRTAQLADMAIYSDGDRPSAGAGAGSGSEYSFSHAGPSAGGERPDSRSRSRSRSRTRPSPSGSSTVMGSVPATKQPGGFEHLANARGLGGAGSDDALSPSSANAATPSAVSPSGTGAGGSPHSAGPPSNLALALAASSSSSKDQREDGSLQLPPPALGAGAKGGVSSSFVASPMPLDAAAAGTGGASADPMQQAGAALAPGPAAPPTASTGLDTTDEETEQQLADDEAESASAATREHRAYNRTETLDSAAQADDEDEEDEEGIQTITPGSPVLHHQTAAARSSSSAARAYTPPPTNVGDMRRRSSAQGTRTGAGEHGSASGSAYSISGPALNAARRTSLAHGHFGYGALAQAQEEAEESGYSTGGGGTGGSHHARGVSRHSTIESSSEGGGSAVHVPGASAGAGAAVFPKSGSMSSSWLMRHQEHHERSPLLGGRGGEDQHHAGFGAISEGRGGESNGHAKHNGYFRGGGHGAGVVTRVREQLGTAVDRARKITWQDAASATAEPVRLLPAVVLGLLLNVLDGVSYGMITFPTSYPIFSNFGGDGVSMFFVTCVLSQLVYTLGGSIFGGGNGSMMIEVVPFYHIFVKTIIDEIGDDNPAAVISTTIVAYALSSIFIGITFLALGWLRLGKLIEFFPRHILVGCIGGVGVFLIETGLEVSARLEAEEGFQWNLETFDYFVQSWHMVALWVPPLLLAILLRVITHKFTHPLIFPAYFMVIPIVFYIVTFPILGENFASLRKGGWVFDIGNAADAPFYRFYTYIDFKQVSIRALSATIPTQLALTFFGILHVPLNVPALGISVGEDNVDTDRELIGHGISNLAAGAFFSGPNYITYVNSLLFYRVGGGSRLSGLMLAAGTFIILLAGPGMIGYLPVMIVGALIFVLGIDLVKESLWDTIGRVNRWEYFTIIIIIIVMTLWDFVVGILAGIILACLFFVVQNSRRKTVRAIFDGSIARSTVRRHMTQRKFLDVVGTQTQILKLQGFLFFGTINAVEQLIRRALDIAAWNQKPMRFLIVDFSLVSGVDFSAAEAFTRIQRLLEAKGVVLVFCGVTPDSDIGIALRNVGMWADQGVRLEVFAHLNSALEWSENEYLRGMYFSNISAGKALSQGTLGTGALQVPDQKRQPAFLLEEAFENSPRRQHLQQAAKLVMFEQDRNLGAIGQIMPPRQPSEASEHGSEDKPQPSHSHRTRAQPLPLLIATFREYGDGSLDEAFFACLVEYFERVSLRRNELLWGPGDEADGLYLIESGILKAKYDFVQENFDLSESMMAGTIAGELTFLSGQPRNTTAHAETDCVLWKLDGASLERLQEEQAQVFAKFFQILLRVAGDEQTALMSYLVSRLT